MDQDRHSVSVSGVVLDHQRRALLIQRRDNGHWEAPGGVLELGEDIVTGLCREVLEETGLVVEPEVLTGVYKNMKQGIVALVFRCTIMGGELVETAESRAYKWATEQEVRACMCEAFAIRVIDAMRNAGTPAVRQHDGTRLVEGDPPN